MSWTILVDKVWCVHWYSILVLAAFYFVPLLKLATFPFESGNRKLMHINKFFGIWEHVVLPARTYLMQVYIGCGALWYIWRGIQTYAWQDFLIAAIALLLAALGVINSRWRKTAHLNLIDFAKRFPTIHPQEFFDHLLCVSGIIRHSLPQEPFEIINPSSLNFQNGRKNKKISFISLIAGLWGIIWIAKLCLLANRFGEKSSARETASSLSVIWGTRICQLMRASMMIEGKDKFPDSKGPEIYLFTHSSFIDSFLTPLVLASNPSSKNHLPIFLIAKDHFKDNFLLYKFLGIGRVAEALDMVFVDRKSRDKIASAKSVSEKAVQSMLASVGSLAIFPQGGRAMKYVNSKGERIGAAYYTVGSRERIKKDGGHLKKGAAHIALNAALALKSQNIAGAVKLIPVAIAGTAVACPKGSIRILSNTEFKFALGDPIVAETSQTADSIHVNIDNSLKNTAHVHAELERRFFEDIRTVLKPHEMEEVALAMKPWRGKDYLAHAILDAIYACKPNRWRGLFGEFIHLQLNYASRDDFLNFKSKVADELFV